LGGARYSFGLMNIGNTNPLPFHIARAYGIAPVKQPTVPVEQAQIGRAHV